MVHPERIKKVLLKAKIITPKKWEEIMTKVKSSKTDLIEYLIANRLVIKEELYDLLAADFKVPFIDLKNINLPKETLELLPLGIMQAHRLVVFNKKKDVYEVATEDPDDLQTLDFIRKKLGPAEIKIYLTSDESIKAVLEQYYETFKQLTSKELPIVKLVDNILEQAIFEGASDIHLEPTEKETVIRFRVDGILHDLMTLPKSLQPELVARIKVLANLKLDEHRLPQDGRFKIETAEHKVAFRVSVLPVFDGEKIVLRLLDESKQILTLEQLGILPEPLEILKRNIKKPHGIIYVTGPTGCGKTTTLYTILNLLNAPQVNITTIEDPIEYRIPRVNQSQVNPRLGFTFATGLRSLLRQDPNIIMVGEIRDTETAEIATHAAMTGHLVLTTLHTNDAVGAIPRLSEMGVAPFLISSTSNIIVAQRLVRKICPHCIQSYSLTKEDIIELEKQYKWEDILAILEKYGEITSKKMPREEIIFYRGVGCAKCSQRGYRGRIGIYEILEVNEKIASLILKRTSKEELLKTALEENHMITIIQDGFIKAKRGITTIEEVLRVTKE